MVDVFLYRHTRTIFGKYAGALASIRPDDLAAAVIADVLRKAQVPVDTPDEVVFGNANGAGEENRNVARMAGLLAGLPTTTPAVTVNRLCGSGMEAAIGAFRQIACGDAQALVAGGVESMSRAPYVMLKPERAFPATGAELVSTTLGWRLVNPAMKNEWTVSLGSATEDLADSFSISRTDMDEWALRSHSLAAKAWDEGKYADTITTVETVDATRDESLRPSTTLEKLATLTPAFRKDGAITAGNASPLNDGAAALLLGSPKLATTAGDPLVRIVASAATALDPQMFGYAPVEAANTALTKAKLSWDDISVVELNEAFAAQALACLRAWPIDDSIVNSWGGALALGHPLGASGARVIATAADRLVESGDRYGIATICIGVGQGLAVVIENARSS